jgi:hypothetical protein
MTPLALALLSVVSTAPVEPLADNECRTWRGSLWGNDRGVSTTLWLCRSAAKLCGTMTWESAVSGRGVREVEGSVTRGSLRLRDLRFLENKPENGWRFCLIDRYLLSRNSETGQLEGSYWSGTCKDEAAMRLEPAVSAEPRPSCFAAR